MNLNKRIHRIYSIVLSIALVIAGICLMAACLNIYNSGERPFSRQAVAEQFAGICVPVYLALALCVGSFILRLVVPEDRQKRKATPNYNMLLENLWKKRDINCAPADLQLQIRKQQKLRKVNTMICAVLLTVCSIVFLTYGANIQNFPTSNINPSIMKAVIFLLICLAIPFGFGIYSAYANRRSLQREIALVKQIEASDILPAPLPRDYTNIARWLILNAALLLLAYGFFAGGTLDVLTKAANICTECVGLG